MTIMGLNTAAPPHGFKPAPHPFTSCRVNSSSLRGPDHKSSPSLLSFTRKRVAVRVESIRCSYDNGYCVDDNACAVSPFPGISRYKSGFPSANKMDFLTPTLLGIYPDPPDWPERREINQAMIERAANRADIPMSLRIIKKKLRVGSGKPAPCSAVKTAFSSMVHIVRELQIGALQLRENRRYEDLKEIVSKVQAEMTESFVWLFRQVFAQTPTLMVYMMILLANFSLYSMTGSPAIAAPLAPVVVTHQDTVEENWFDLVRTGLDEDYDVFSRRTSQFNLSDEELTIGEAIMWNSVMEDVEEMRGEFLDEQLIGDLVSPVLARPEVEESWLNEKYETMDILYQVSLSQDPTNPLLLSNYAQFLTQVTRNYNWAEELFNLAIQAEPTDADAFCKYADFLWTVRKDGWAAEERYQQAIAEDPDNPHYAAKYANFLWSTGGDETCYPLDAPNDWYINPKLSKTDELP